MINVLLLSVPTSFPVDSQALQAFYFVCTIEYNKIPIDIQTLLAFILCLFNLILFYSTPVESRALQAFILWIFYSIPYYLMDGVWAGVPVGPDVSELGHLLLISLPLHHLHRHGRWTKDIRRTVGLGEAAEGGGIRGVVVILVLHDFPAGSAAGLELIPQLCCQVLDVPH